LKTKHKKKFVKYSNAPQEVYTIEYLKWDKNEENVNIHYRKPVAYKVKIKGAK